MSGDLKWNKIMGACLGTAFVILVVQQVSGMVYHTKQPEKMGYFVDAPEESAGAEPAALPMKPPSRAARPATRSTPAARTASVRT